MTTPTHILVGTVIAKIAIKTGAVPGTEPSLIYLISILAANLPDFDAPFSVTLPAIKGYLKGMGLTLKKNHRTESIFHYPIFWFLVFYLASFLVRNSGDIALVGYYHLTMINVVVHLFLDTFGVGNGICWLQPFSKRDFSFLPLLEETKNLKEIVLQYKTHVLLKYEAALWVVSAIFLLKK